MRILKYVIILILSLLAWTAIVNLGINSGLLLRPITSENTAESFIEATKAKLEKESVGNFALAVIENGEVAQDFYHSIDQAVDKQTIFQMASVSKWITAWGIFALVEDGKIELDDSVEDYLSRWHLPQSEFNNNEVTFRNLLCHTSGLEDGLGYAGFESQDSIQTIEESLTKANDAFHTEGITKVGYQPNSDYRYSGGGYTLLQLLIEEISGQSFNDFMTEAVFKPLGMENTSFRWSNTSTLHLSTFYDTDLSIAPHYRYTALAAASLYTNVEDLTLFLKANISSNDVLDRKTLEMMNQNHVTSGNGMHGLGPIIYGIKGHDNLVIGHDGVSLAAINNSARINVKTGDGIIILQTGNWNFASRLADEWAYWKTGIPDNTVMSSSMNSIIIILIIGYIIILALFIPYMRKKLRTKGE